MRMTSVMIIIAIAIFLLLMLGCAGRDSRRPAQYLFCPDERETGEYYGTTQQT